MPCYAGQTSPHLSRGRHVGLLVGSQCPTTRARSRTLRRGNTVEAELLVHLARSTRGGSISRRAAPRCYVLLWVLTRKGCLQTDPGRRAARRHPQILEALSRGSAPDGSWAARAKLTEQREDDAAGRHLGCGRDPAECSRESRSWLPPASRAGSPKLRAAGVARALSRLLRLPRPGTATPAAATRRRRRHARPQRAARAERYRVQFTAERDARAARGAARAHAAPGPGRRLGKILAKAIAVLRSECANRSLQRLRRPGPLDLTTAERAPVTPCPGCHRRPSGSATQATAPHLRRW